MLGRVRADRFGPSHVRAYVEARRKEGEPRTLALTESWLLCGADSSSGIARNRPSCGACRAFPKLQGNDPRRGFIEQPQYEAILRELPERLKALFVCGYHLGCRLSELRKLQWGEVDLDARQIRILASVAKNGEARTVPNGEMDRWLASQHAGCGAQPWVLYGRIPRPVGAHLDGWREACERAGVPGLLFP